MAAMTDQGVDTLVEIGPGNMLSGLAKRSMKGITTTQISSSGDLGQ
jgi:[acyl-carrier-protein] S-malonyltransferase